jgi:hypothetical protein
MIAAGINDTAFVLTSLLHCWQDASGANTLFIMAKKAAERSVGESVEQEHLNALIPKDLKRRMMIARANTGRPMSALLVEWIEKGLSEVEKVPQQAKR